MEQHHRKLLDDGEKLFSDRQGLESLWQDIALHFYPEVAEFTSARGPGGEFAEHLTTSYPLLARRTLGDAFAALLRPTTLDTTSPGVWFGLRTDSEANEDNAAKRWMEDAATVMRRAMYDRAAQFVRATKEGDHMFATFGQAPISIQLNKRRDALLYQCHHLKNVAWTENAEGKINGVWRKWNPTVTQLVDTFGRNVDPKVNELLNNSPYARINTRHIVVESGLYETRSMTGKRFRQPWVSLWLDVDNQHVMEEVGSWSKVYLIPRWVTVPGSQYASSPAVTAALPDARLIQAITLTLLEASEKYADPPLVGKQEIVRADVNTLPGGLTWIDMEYDGKVSDALQPLYHPNASQSMGSGFEMRSDTREMIAKAFFLDSLSMPPAGTKDMTAFEVGERISEWIRRANPIFEPMEFEYNGGLCEETFDILMRNGAFGPVENIPDSLRGADIEFKFESPLHQSADRRKGQKFLEAKAALLQAAELDPSTMPMLNAKESLRDVLSAIGVPAKWTRGEQEMEEIERTRQEAEAMQQAIGGTAAGAEIAKNLGSAAKDFTASRGA